MEHMELLNKIIEVEEMAQRIAGEAKAERGNLSDELRVLRDKLNAEYHARAERRIQIVREQEEAQAAERIELMDATLAEDLERLESYFREHRDEMVDELFIRVIGE